MSKLILASNSFARKEMLKKAGYDFEVMPADIDEETIKNNSLKHDNEIHDIAQILADEKAWSISKENKEDYIIGSDQILIFNGQIISKSKNKIEAFEKIKMFKGKTHYLISSVTVIKNEENLFSCTNGAALTMKDLSDIEIKKYCDKAGDILTQCVGGYAFEEYGIRLFSEVEGDYHSILGMPLLSLSKFLDTQGFTL